MLDMLQDPQVRAAVGRDDVMRLFHSQQFFHWKQHGVLEAAAPPVKTEPPA